MSKILDQLPKSQTGFDSRYPWADWTDGRVWQIKRGEDFTIRPTVMYAQLGVHASRHGLKVVKRLRGDVIAFQFSPAS
jgi:hypothetical protein